MVRVMGYLFHTLASKFPSAISCYHRDAGKKWELPRHGKTYFHKTMCTVPCPALFSLAIQIPTYNFHFPFFAPNRQGKSVVIARICIFNAEVSTENLWPHTPWAAQKTFDLTSLVPYKHGGRSKSHLPVATPNSHRNWHVGGGKWKVGIGK